jgi:hypothetical protein
VSIGTYTGNNTAGATVGHGLGVAPELVLYKNRDAVVYWLAYHKDLTADRYMFFNEANASADANVFNDTHPTSTNLVLGTDVGINANTVDYVYMAFAPSQFISIGSYTNNNSTNGTYVPTINSLGVPLQPRFVLTKTLASANWMINDAKRIGYNVDNNSLYPNETTPESTADVMDIVTGGFKLRTSNDPNYSTSTTVYMAIGTPIIDTDGRIIAGR